MFIKKIPIVGHVNSPYLLYNFNLVAEVPGIFFPRIFQVALWFFPAFFQGIFSSPSTRRPITNPTQPDQGTWRSCEVVKMWPQPFNACWRWEVRCARNFAHGGNSRSSGGVFFGGEKLGNGKWPPFWGESKIWWCWVGGLKKIGWIWCKNNPFFIWLGFLRASQNWRVFQSKKASV